MRKMAQNRQKSRLGFGRQKVPLVRLHLFSKYNGQMTAEIPGSPRKENVDDCHIFFNVEWNLRPLSTAVGVTQVALVFSLANLWKGVITTCE